MDKDIEILKEHWQALCSSLGRLEIQIDIKARNQSKVSKITRFYKRFFVLGLCWIVLAPLLLSYVGMPIVMGLMCSAYFAIMSVMNFVMMNKVSEIDYSTMSVRALLHAIRSSMKMKKIMQIVGACLAVPLLSYMLYSFQLMDIWVFYGGMTGLILGLTIGLCTDYKIRKTFRDLEKELTEE